MTLISAERSGESRLAWWPGDEVGTTDTAKKHLRRHFPQQVPFETPKPEELAARVIRISTDPGDLANLGAYSGPVQIEGI